jgi:hypothetical protein
MKLKTRFSLEEFTADVTFKVSIKGMHFFDVRRQNVLFCKFGRTEVADMRSDIVVDTSDVSVQLVAVGELQVADETLLDAGQ